MSELMNNKFNRKRDANHEAVVEALRGIGCRVVDMGSVGQIVPGYPDLDSALRGMWVKIEIKQPNASGKIVFTDAEKEFIRKYARYAPIFVATSAQDAVQKMGIMVNRRVKWQDPLILEILGEG